MMNAEQVLKLKVIDTSRAATVGEVSGLLIDGDEKRVAALTVSQPGGLRGHTRYLPLTSITAIENDVLTIPSSESLLDRKSFKEPGMMESLTGRKVITEDGRELGEVRSYSFDPRTGDITSLTFSVSKAALGGLWKTEGQIHDTPGKFIRALGEHVMVDNSVPDIVGQDRGA